MLSTNLSYVYGQTKSRFLSTNYRLADRYYAALDAVRDPSTGQIVCRSDLDPAGLIDPNPTMAGRQSTFTPGANSGCQPLDLLGDGVGEPSRARLHQRRSRQPLQVQQHVLSGFHLRRLRPVLRTAGWTDRVRLRRRIPEGEESAFNSIPTYAEQGALLDLAQVLPEKGSFDVRKRSGNSARAIVGACASPDC